MGGANITTCAFKSRKKKKNNDVAERKVRENLKYEKDSMCLFCLWRLRGAWIKKCDQSLEGDNNPRLTTKKKMETSVLQSQGTKFCQLSE